MNIKTYEAVALTLIVVAAACSASTPARVAPSPATVEVPAAAPPAAVAAPGGEPQEIEILQIGNAFSPSRVTLKAGTAVRFLVSNHDPEAHNLVSLDTRYPVPENQERTGGTFAVDWIAPKVPGDYWIMCSFHPPNMRLRVVVQ